MGKMKIKKADKPDPTFVVYVMCSISIKIYQTPNPDEAKECAVGRIRELFDQIDSDIYIPRAIVMPYGMSAEEIENMLNETTAGKILMQQEKQKDQYQEENSVTGNVDPRGPVLSAEGTSNLLAGIGVLVPPMDIRQWTAAMIDEAIEWAAAQHWTTSSSITTPTFLLPYITTGEENV